MIKKTMLAAIVAAFAFTALPALASAEKMDLPANPHFSVAGGPATLATTVEGETLAVECESSTGTGEFDNERTGHLQLTFHGCADETFGVPCTTPGSPEGTITTTELTFHLKEVEHEGKEGHGVLITPHEGHFATFECSFLFHIEVTGNGIVGTITEPETGVLSNTATLKFSADGSNPHRQTHTTVVGDETEYDLKTSVNGGPAETSAETAEGTLSFAGGGEGRLTEG